MRDRVRTALLVTVVVLTAATATLPHASAHHLDGPCDFHRKDGEALEHLSRRHIRCAVEDFGPVPGGRRRAVCIARRESGLDPEVTSPGGQYLGLFQHAAEYWDLRYKEWTRRRWDLPRSALEGRTNAIVTIRMVHDAGSWTDAGWPRHRC